MVAVNRPYRYAVWGGLVLLGVSTVLVQTKPGIREGCATFVSAPPPGTVTGLGSIGLLAGVSTAIVQTELVMGAVSAVPVSALPPGTVTVPGPLGLLAGTLALLGAGVVRRFGWSGRTALALAGIGLVGVANSTGGLRILHGRCAVAGPGVVAALAGALLVLAGTVLGVVAETPVRRRRPE